MNKGSDEILEAKIAENSERAKKLYRYVSDVARRVGEATAGSRTISDLFSTHIEVQRQKLRDNCEKLLFMDPLNYGKKSLELLWRKVYYDTVSAAKKLRESDNDYDSYLSTHIVCGIGHFHHFIARIQAKMKVQVMELDYVPLHKDEETEDTCDVTLDDELQFGRSLLHSCLIYLGDLSRYQTEIFHTFDPSISARYYLQAAHIDMSSGMPYNQLGNLYLDRNYNLDSVCYYIHCLSCTTPFDGAMGNLTKIFEKYNQYSESLNEAETVTQSEHIQNTVANFLSLIEIWYLNKNDTNIPQRCNAIAQELKVAMDFNMTELPDIDKSYTEYTQVIEEENVNPSYLTGSLVHKMVLICLFTMSKMIEIDEKKAFACKAFTLALFSQLLQRLLKQLESFGLKNPAHNYKPRTTLVVLDQEMVEDKSVTVNEHEEEVQYINITNGKGGNHQEKGQSPDEKSDDDTKILQNGDAKNGTKKTPTKRRRRRRGASSDSSDLSDDDTEVSEASTDESCSDEEDLSDSTYVSEEGSKSDESFEDGLDTDSMNEKLNGKNPDEVVKPASSDAASKHIGNNIEEKTQSPDNNNEINEINETEVKKFLLGDNFLPSIKLLQDWILTEKDLILSCGDSGDSLFQCVVDLLNIFTDYFSPKSKEHFPNESKVLEYTKSVAKKLKLEYKTIPLPEDINLRGSNICKFDKDAAEWQILNRYKPSVYEESIMRIMNFVDFGNQIAKIVPRIRYNRSMKIFYLKKIPHPKLNSKVTHKRTKEWHNCKKQITESSEGGLLRRLGRLWLTSQVRELERSGRAAAAPALLALDAAALHAHLRRVKQLLRARSFVLLVPAIVLQELDDLKRERSTARDAIRWLEMQLKSGSRFLRAQRAGQSKPLPLLKCPRKAPPFVHNFMQILEFCNHFIADEKQNQGGNGEPDSSHGKSTPLLILLVGNEPGQHEEQYKEFSLTGAAQSAGISVEYIGDFYTKWRQSVHKSGKKR